MQINITYDSSVASAPAGYKAAINAAVKFFDETFSTPITVNITVGWGEVGGTALPAGSVGGSSTTFVDQGITGDGFVAALFQNAQLAQPGLDTALQNVGIPGFGGQGLYGYSAGMPFAEDRALGLASVNPSVPDGYIALNSSVAYTFNPNDRAVAGKYDAIGLLESEIAQVLGVVSFGEVDAPPPYDTPLYTPLDLFRYLSPGVHDYSPANSYFSLNGEQMLLPFNNSGEGNPAGWASSVTGDALGAFAEVGTELNFSTIDIRLMQVLGYDVSDMAPTPNGTPTKPLVVAKTQGNASGHTLNYDGPYAVLLDNNVTYTNRGSIIDSGTCSQIDVVGVTENTGDSDPSNSVFSNAAGATLSVTATAVAADAAGYYGYDNINNAGHIQVVSDQADAWGVFSNSFQNSGLLQVTSDQSNATGVGSNTFTNAKTATLIVQAENDAVGSSGGSDANAGQIQVSGYDATGVENNTFTNAATGTLIVQAENNAFGYVANDDAFTNAGKIEVTGLNALAVDAPTSIDNSGTIEATSVGQGGTSTGVYLYGLPTSSANDINSGLIQGQIAVKIGGFPNTNYTFDNSGTINGIFEALTGGLTIDNTGTINGAIELSNGSYVYDGASGKQTGGIFLDYATNSATLGNDGEAVAGGGGADTITGGKGNDFIEIFGGNNAINGGGGFNTLSFADAAMAVTINLAAGTASVDGTDTVQNIQEVIGGTYGDTMIAGSQAVTFIAGSGKDTLTGGAGNDTLVAGAGGDTMTGGGGNNTFIYSAGDNQLVITDFGTADDKNVLDIDGYTTAQSVTQQGANTLITLSATDSILLDNVTASSLTPSEFAYNANPYQAPPTPISVPIFGTTTIAFSYALTIPFGEYINETNQAVGFYYNPGGSIYSFDPFTNYGSIMVSQSSGNVVGVASQSSGAANSNIINEAGATFVVTDSDPAGVATGNNMNPDAFANWGLFSVSAQGDAYGFNSGNQNATLVNESTGTFAVTSATGTAIGFYVFNGLEAGPHGTEGIINNGTIDITGAVAAYAVETGLFGLTGGLDNYAGIVNNGTIIVSGENSSTATYGLAVAPSSYITNAGTITAGIAIEGIGFSVNDNGVYTIINTGTINGDIDLAAAAANSTVLDSGTLNGNVAFSDGDCLFNSTGGTISGVVTTGYGKNTITFGSSGGSFIGGGYEDTVTGGAGNNFFEIGRGDNSITGGSGINTLSLADSDMGVTVNLAAGTVTGAGTSTISNIQVVIGSSFNDTLIAGSAAATLIAGSGHDVLEGGAGNDTLVAGAGGDTMSGGGGDNTFIYSIGDQHLIIKDFDANDVLDVDGYSKAVSISQQGANTLITLASGANILLDNVEASSLNSLNLVFDANPWVAPVTPASAPIFFSSEAPIIIDYAEDVGFTTYAGENINIVANNVDNAGVGDNRGIFGDSNTVPVLDNAGTINVTSTSSEVLGVYLEFPWPETRTVINAGSGTLSVTDAVGAGCGIAIGSQVGGNQDYDNAIVRNEGTISVNVGGDATGVVSGIFTNSSHAVLDVTSATGSALGVFEPTNNLTNNGTITVAAAQSAIGIENAPDIYGDQGLYDADITNNGTITVTSTHPADGAIGIEVGSNDASLGGQINNYGTITAQTAIVEVSSVGFYEALSVYNDGTINGSINMGAGDSQLGNGGTINGSITFLAGPVDIPNGGQGQEIDNGGVIDGNLFLFGSALTATNTGAIVGTEFKIGTGTEFISAGGSVVMGTGVSALVGTVADGAGGTIAGAGTIEANVSIATGATFQAAGGTLEVIGAVTGGGNMTVGNGAILDIDGSDTAPAQFATGSGILQMGPASFSGAIGGLQVGDVIDLSNITAVSANISSGVLSVVDNHGNDYTFNISGSLTGNAFAIVSDDQGGTDLVFEASGAVAGIEADANAAHGFNGLPALLVSELESLEDAHSPGAHISQPYSIFQLVEQTLFHSDVLL